MLSDDDIDKLCRGRIIKASFYNSAGSNAAGPHYAVILDTDVKKTDEYLVAVISHDETDSEFLISVPGYTGLNGFIQCAWIETAHLAGITKIGAKLRIRFTKTAFVSRKRHSFHENGIRFTKTAFVSRKGGCR